MTQFNVILSFSIDGMMRRFPDQANVIVYTEEPRGVFVAVGQFKHEFHKDFRFQRSQNQVLLYELNRLTALLIFDNENEANHFITLSEAEPLRIVQKNDAEQLIAEDVDLDLLVQFLQDDSFVTYCQHVDQVLQLLMI